jgi:hypothetical protein
MAAVQIHHVLRRTFILVLMLSLAGGLLRAQSQKFEQARNALNDQAQAQQKQQGLSGDRAKLFSQYPCPEIPLVKTQQVAPGAAVPIVLNGKFPKGTTLLSDHDGAALLGTLAGNTFTGRLTVAPNQLPNYVHVYAFTPVSHGFTMTPVAFIGSVYSFDVRGQNGWTIKATPTASAWQVSDQNAVLPYRVEFYRQNEVKPFETMDAQLSYSSGSTPTNEINMNLQAAASGAAAEMQALSKKMSDTQSFLKLSQAEQTALVNRMGQLQQQMMKEMMTGVSDPAAMQKKQDDFGCHNLTLRAGQSGSVSGTVQCGRNVNNGSLTVNGTMAAR